MTTPSRSFAVSLFPHAFPGDAGAAAARGFLQEGLDMHADAWLCVIFFKNLAVANADDEIDNAAGGINNAPDIRAIVGTLPLE
jgi:hypothetical protein